MDMTLSNVAVDGEWIEGDIRITGNVLGLNIDKTQHFKTKKDIEQELGIAGDFVLIIVGSLEPPNKACVAGKIKKGFFGIDLPKQCVNVT